MSSIAMINRAPAVRRQELSSINRRFRARMSSSIDGEDTVGEVLLLMPTN